MTQRITLRGIIHRVSAKLAIDTAPPDSVVTIRGPGRTKDQDAKMWGDLRDIARADPNGEGWPPETWKTAFMDALGHEVQWYRSLDGTHNFPVGYSTSSLTKRQFSDLIEAIHAYAAGHGIYLKSWGLEE